MRYDVSDKDNRDVFLCIRQSVLAGTEEIKYRVDEYESNCHEDQPYDDIKTYHIAENLVGCLVVLLTE